MAAALPEWDLTDLYPSIKAPNVKKDIAKADRLTKKFAKSYEGKVEKLSGPKLGQAVAEYEAIQDILGRLASYAQLLYAGDMNDPAIAQFYQNTVEKVTELSTGLLFFTLAINKIPEKQLKKKLKDEALKNYKPWLRDVRSFKPYQLDDTLETFLHEKSVTGHSAWNRLFDESIARLRFPVGGKELTSAEALDLLSDSNADTRMEAAKSIGVVFEQNKGLFALISNTLAKDKAIEDDWRGFERPISYRNAVNQVEDEVVDALVATVRSNYSQLSHRYYRWKAKQFNRRTLPYWDRNAPLPKVAEKTYGWNEAKDIVLSSYAAFSPQMAKIGKKFFDKNWIDVPVRPGKAPGAFAHPTVPSAHPYLLLNFQGKTRDVMTLAHELGHGVHQVLSAKQGALMADTPLTLAETASVFGEMLTFQELLRREKNVKRRKILIASKVEDMLNTVVRQIAFCTFEMRLHDERKQGELTADRIGEIWMDVQKESLGPGIKLYKEYQNYWCYIPHFIHTPFYVYAYAFGDCLVNSLYAAYLKDAEKGKARDFEQRYIAMLEAGGTLRHKALLKPFGLNASKADFWQKGLDVVASYIDQLEA